MIGTDAEDPDVVKWCCSLLICAERGLGNRYQLCWVTWAKPKPILSCLCQMPPDFFRRLSHCRWALGRGLGLSSSAAGFGSQMARVASSGNHLLPWPSSHPQQQLSPTFSISQLSQTHGLAWAAPPQCASGFCLLLLGVGEQLRGCPCKGLGENWHSLQTR